jgi:iron complex outermembrane receptor protein
MENKNMPIPDRFVLTAVALSAASCITLTPALAADAADPTLAEVIVTATKRNENIRDIPMPISALTGADLSASNANSLSDYIVRLPGVVFNDYQPGISEVIIRGVSATTYHEQGQTTVGYYLNEVVLVEPGFPIGIPDIDTFDLERVEVLRGPQGTLFGASALGGLVNYVVKTADPARFDAAAQLLAGQTDHAGSDMNYGVKGMVNVPLIADELAFRLTALERSDAGYIDNLGTGEDGVNDFRTRGARGSLAYTPTEATKLVLLSAYQETQLDDQTYLNIPTYERNLPRAEPQDTDFWLTSLRLDQDVGFGTFTALASYDEKTNTTVFSYPFPYVTGATSGAASAYSVGDAEAEIKTLEVRLTSSSETAWRWLVGASYLNAEKSSVDRIYQPGAAAFINANPGLFGGFSGSVLAPNDAIYGYSSDTENDDLGLFGEVSFWPSDQWEITLGGRYYDTKNTAMITNAAGSLSAGSFAATDAIFGMEQKEDGFTPKATVAWHPGSDTLFYATYSQGFRVGGPNPNAAILAGIPTAYDSDTTENYEIGTKLTLLDRRVLLDLTVFHIDWTDIQARLFTAAPYFYSYVTNAGSADIDGVEFSVTVALNDWLSFSNNTTWQDARLATFLPDTFAAGGGYRPGTTLPGSSEWTVANNLKAEWSSANGEPSIELAHRYISSAPVAFGNPPPAERGNFNIYDLRGSIGLGENYRLLAFINNISDEYGVLNAPFADQLTPAGSIVRPRTYGVRMDWHF